jgi:hypothetical protein
MLFFGLCICEAWWTWNMANLEKENESYKGLVGLVVKEFTCFLKYFLFKKY